MTDKGAERMWLTVIAAALAASEINARLKLLPFEPAPIAAFGIQVLYQLRADMRQVEPDDLMRLQWALSALSSKAIVVETGKPIRKGDLLQINDQAVLRGEVLMRQELDTGTTLVHTGAWPRRPARSTSRFATTASTTD